ncbi:MAG TPA: type II toxin-antitoxin system ParD family antitoxin, partial [Acetobacteraceae bacterium]|nr:type II toxin-antitoxin system ParD family antitoxin [Acetobacteraceae bacterium]
ELERFAQSCVESGRYNNVSEVVRAGLRMLLDIDEQRRAFVASLEEAVAEGDRIGFLSIEESRADIEAAIREAASAKAG